MPRRFSIGFDPKIGDHLLNEDHDIQTNFTWELGIDTDKGMAIPIRNSDHISGDVDFRILGLVNSFYYNKIIRRHRTWFRSEKWTKEAVPLMANVRNVFIKDFSIKLYSNNSMADNSGDNDGDMVYMSDTDEDFYNKKDDLEFKIHSASHRLNVLSRAFLLSLPLLRLRSFHQATAVFLL